MRITIFILSIILFLFGAFLSYSNNTSGATVTYTAAVFCLIFAFLQEFKKFKGFGVEAELLEKKIEEADNVLKRLRSLAVPISELLFTMVARGGRWDSAVPRKDSYRLMTQFTSELKELGIPDKEIQSAKNDWHRYNIIDLSRPLVQKVIDLTTEKIREQEKITKSFGFRRPVSTEDQPAHRESIEKTNQMRLEQEKIKKLPKLDSINSSYDYIIDYFKNSYLIDESEKEEIMNEMREELLDLQHYCTNSEFRRLDVWLNEEK